MLAWLNPSKFFSVFLLFSLIYDVAQARSVGDYSRATLGLTQEEYAWIANHPVVTYTDADWPPLFTLDAETSTPGQSIFDDVYRLVGLRTGLRFQYKTYSDFGSMLNAVYSSDVDIIDGTGITPERKNKALFSKPYMEFPLALVTRKSNQHWNTLEKLTDQRVAVAANYTAHEYLVNEYPQLELLLTNSTEEALRLVASGKADMAVDILPVVYHAIHYLGLANLSVSGLTDYHFRIHAMVRQSAPELVSILDKAFASLTPNDIDQIYEHHVGGLSKLLTRERQQYSTLVLSDDERIWLEANHKVRVRISDWQPFLFSRPAPSGIMVDILDNIARRFNFKVDYVVDDGNLSDALEDLAGPRQHYDSLLNMSRTMEWSQQFAFTSDFITSPWVIFARKDSSFISGIDGLNGKTVAIENTSTITDKLKKNYPNIKILEWNSVTDALVAVATGKADAYVGDLTNAIYLIKENRLDNLMVVAPTPFGNQSHAMAIRSDWWPLASLIDKGLAAMTIEERNAINQKWGMLEVLPSLNYALMWEISAAVGLILIIFLYWNQRLRREVVSRKQTETALLASKEFADAVNRELQSQKRQLEIVIDNLPAVFFTKDAKGRCLMVNNRFTNALGVSKDFVLGRTEREIFPPEVAEAIRKTDQKIITEGKPVTLEEKLPHPDGQWHEYLTTKVPLLDDDGHFTAMIGIAIDITDLKAMQQELIRMRDAADTANRSKSIFLANMSHEIRTPMNAILGFSNLLKQQISQPDQLEYLENIAIASNHLLGVINDILDFSKIEANLIQLEEAAFRLTTLTSNTKAILAQQVQAKGLQYIESIDPKLEGCIVSGDPLRLGQVLMNIVNNAVKFTEKGSITVGVYIESESLDGYLIRFEVQDTGIGINEEQQSRLFRAFEQADVSTARKYGGTGLGLALSRKFIELMGGEIGVDSELGKGSCFWFTVKLKPASVSDLEPQYVSDSKSGDLIKQHLGGVRILIAEDDAFNRLLAEQQLKVTGYELVFVENGKEAVEKARTEQFGLILMDIQMPELNGLEATRLIRQLPGYADIPIIAMTANAFNEDRQACIDAGMNDHLSKPVVLEKLFDMLLKWLQKPTSLA